MNQSGKISETKRENEDNDIIYEKLKKSIKSDIHKSTKDGREEEGVRHFP